MQLKQFLPNLFTLANLFSACLAIVLVLDANMQKQISFWLFDDALKTLLFLFALCLLFDFLDGLIARWLNVQSDIGVQLDSLADVVSFGLLPSVLMMLMLEPYCVALQWKLHNSNYADWSFLISLIPFFGFVLVLCSAYRLAKFNLDKEQTYYFKGLPTPANAIFFVGLFAIVSAGEEYVILYDFPWIMVLLPFFFGYLLVSNLPLFSLKFNNFSWYNNHYKYLFLATAIVMIVIWKILAIPNIILLYILISILFRKKIVS